MEKSEESGSPGWSASFFMQTTEDVARAVAAAAAAVHSPRPSVVYSSKVESGGQLHRLQQHVSRIIKGLSSPPEVKSGPYNPEILTSQKRQWASFQLQSLDHRVWKEPSNLFENMVVVGLPPSSDIQALQNLYFSRKSEGSGRFRSALGGQNQSRVEPNLDPQVLFVYPPGKQLPLKYKDLLSFCFPAGVEVNAVERTPSMSELNEILLGQEHLKQSDLSFVFRLQVADDSTLYGCCVLVDEIIQKPSGLISMMSDGHPFSSSLGRHILTTRRCYCILSRLPFFELHFGVLNSIFTEERLERLTKEIYNLDLESPASYDEDETREESNCLPLEDGEGATSNRTVEERVTSDTSFFKNLNLNDDSNIKKGTGVDVVVADTSIENNNAGNQSVECHLPNTTLSMLKFQQLESSESSSREGTCSFNKCIMKCGCSVQGSPSEYRHFRSDMDEAEVEEASSSGQDVLSEHSDIIDWAKANKHGSLCIICEYYRLNCPTRGSTLKFHPLDHLHPLEYHRPNETVLHVAGSTIDLRSCSTSLEFAEAHSALMVEEEAAALSVWAVACLCGSLRLEHVLTLFAAALLEKQIVVVCSNLVGYFVGYSFVNYTIDSTVSMAELINAALLALTFNEVTLVDLYVRMCLQVLPNDMLDFLDAPVPYIVGVKNKTTEVQSKMTNVILVDANRNQMKSPTIPQLPQQRELYSCLSPYHAKLVGESYLGKRRPVYDCTPVQVEAARSFLGVLRTYLDSLCSNIRSHTITNVQSNNDKVCLILEHNNFSRTHVTSYLAVVTPFVLGHVCAHKMVAYDIKSGCEYGDFIKIF
ncbi:hypothetical protein F511_27090 [Dorcoceras hygrometricum]|uniref:UDENN domain-containing protein n=1 Tax=Dorcoceras hygrometricum TaxID=472368 RepID=A0A2Z7AB84_9LAMI|nr:hypothetical protein F511_27090 [Dorcoceras hygrometricum]